MTDEQKRDEAIEGIRRALIDAGPRPDLHYAVLARHTREWPTLWKQIDALLRAVDPR